MEGKAQAQVEDKDARRRRREIFFIFLILFVLFVLTSLEFSIGRFHIALPFNDSILFFSIININIILILLLIFLIVRNVVKLVFERRRRILGAHLRNKLVAAFVLLSLVPTGILFYVAWSFISRSIEMWVHVEVERALEGSLAVARAYYKSQAEDTLFFAKQIKQTLKREGVLKEGEKDNLREFLRLEQVAYRLDAIYLVAQDRTMLVDPSFDQAFPGPLVPEKSELEKVKDGQDITRIRESGGGELIEAMVPIDFTERGACVKRPSSCSDGSSKPGREDGANLGIPGAAQADDALRDSLQVGHLHGLDHGDPADPLFGHLVRVLPCERDHHAHPAPRTGHPGSGGGKLDLSDRDRPRTMRWGSWWTRSTG